MLLAGDDLGHSQGGNNNAYCQDNHLTWLHWSQAQAGLVDCISRLLVLRQRHAALRPLHWLSGRPDAAGWRDVVWLHPDGHELHGSDWADSVDRAMALRLVAPAELAQLADPARPASAGSLPLPGLQLAGPAETAPQQAPMALLITLNPLDHPRRFVLPVGDWRAEFCSTSTDGVPIDVDDRPSTSPIATPLQTELPAHALRVYVAPLASLGRPDTAPLDAPVPAQIQAGTASPFANPPATVDRRGEP
jgi:glycogen operon protein